MLSLLLAIKYFKKCNILFFWWSDKTPMKHVRVAKCKPPERTWGLRFYPATRWILSLSQTSECYRRSALTALPCLRSASHSCASVLRVSGHSWYQGLQDMPQRHGVFSGLCEIKRASENWHIARHMHRFACVIHCQWIRWKHQMHAV